MTFVVDTALSLALGFAVWGLLALIDVAWLAYWAELPRGLACAIVAQAWATVIVMTDAEALEHKAAAMVGARLVTYPAIAALCVASAAILGA